MEKKSPIKIAVTWLFAAYFVILFAERLQSLIRIAVAHDPFFPSFFGSFVNILTVLSLAVSCVMLSSFWISLFKQDAEPNFIFLSITAGVLLLSGMVHTTYTVAVAQFIAYGALIAALVLQTIVYAKTKKNKFFLWYNLVYLVSFSMAIPVMYETHIENAALFYAVEIAAVLLLVPAFTFLMIRVFSDKGSDLLLWIPFVLTVALDTVILSLRWQETINMFVLIFAVLTAFLFAVGKVLSLFMEVDKS